MFEFFKMHAVSLAPHTQCMRCNCKKITRQKKMIDERFERPWQPLKGIPIKNIYVPELSYPTTKKILI
jgi:hypothetical protein